MRTKVKKYILLVRKEIDITQKPTKEQIEMLHYAFSSPFKYDEDCPELSGELQYFKQISKEKQLEGNRR